MDFRALFGMIILAGIFGMILSGTHQCVPSPQPTAYAPPAEITELTRKEIVSRPKQEVVTMIRGALAQYVRADKSHLNGEREQMDFNFSNTQINQKQAVFEQLREEGFEYLVLFIKNRPDISVDELVAIATKPFFPETPKGQASMTPNVLEQRRVMKWALEKAGRGISQAQLAQLTSLDWDRNDWFHQ